MSATEIEPGPESEKETVTASGQRDEIELLIEHALSPANVAGRATGPQAEPRQPIKQPRLTVAWGDLTRSTADLHVVGHYQDVLPVAAERALDDAISGKAARGIITEHTRRRWLVGRLGEIAYFPSAHETVRTAVVAGMGRHGTFNGRAPERLYASLMGEMARLPHVARAAMVLIGSGSGNLTIAQAARAVVAGFGQTLLGLSEAPALDEVVIVEIDRFRAEKIRRALERALEGPAPPMRLSDKVEVVGQGRVSLEAATVYAVVALARLSAAAEHESDGDTAAGPMRTVLTGVDDEIRTDVAQGLRDLATVEPSDFDVRLRGGEDTAVSGSVPVRISVLSSPGALRWAAITERATVPERLVAKNEALFNDLVRRLNRPSPQDSARLPELLVRMLIPEDFQPFINDQAPLIFELDRSTARLHWEFLTDVQARDESREPLVLRTPLARQLRTAYTRMAINETPVARLRALVVGDPGDPEERHSLPGARGEALAVRTQLEGFGVEVSAFIGAPNVPREGPLEDIPVASRLDVLRELLSGNYEIVHYSGHGVFDPEDPTRRAGWMFADGLLTSVELGQLNRAPRLVVANACHTSKLGSSRSTLDEGSGSREGPPPAVANPGLEALNPALADEFLRSGVAHYLGAAWEVPDKAGVRFSETFYSALLGEQLSVGEAVQRARGSLWQGEPARGTAWAAYQHYGDPVDILSADFSSSGRTGA